jgi:predicted RecA/RadA family phage recombinase
MSQVPAIFVQEGDCLDYTPVAAAKAGQVVVDNGTVGIVVTDTAAGAKGAKRVEGVFDVPKDANAVDSGAVVYWHAAGDPVGGDAGSGAANVTSAGGTAMGYATQAALAGDAKVRVRLFEAPSVSVTITTLDTPTIADPGNAGAIPVNQGSGHVALVTAAAETRTLAVPAAVGQRLLLYMKTDGGNCVVTVASAFNQAG